MAGDSRKVLYDYQARGAGEITIHEDEVVEIFSEDSGHEGWFIGKNSSGEYGLLPGNYVSRRVLYDVSLAKASPSFLGVVEELVAKAKQSFGDIPSSDSEFKVPSKLMVNWENDVPFYHSGKEGVYILASELLQIPAAASLMNSRPYWIKENKEDAIWFDPESDNSWNIGAMKDVGTSTYNITSIDKTSMPFEAINWEYQKGRNWIPTTDIKVQEHFSSNSTTSLSSLPLLGSTASNPTQLKHQHDKMKGINPLFKSSAKAGPMVFKAADHGTEVLVEQIAPDQAEAPTGSQPPPGGDAIVGQESDFVIEGGIVEPFVETAIIMLVPEKYTTVAASVSNIVICLANTYILESLAVALGVAFNPIGGVNTTAIALYLIKKKIKELQKDVDKLLHADYQTALNRYQIALTLMTNPKMQREAFKEFKEVMNLAERAYTQVKKFDEKILCKKLSLSSRLMTFLYQRDDKTFLPLEKLSEDEKSTIAQYVFGEITTSINDYHIANSELPKNWFNHTNQQNLGKSKNQNLLDSFLKYGLPLIWHFNEEFREEPKNSEKILKFIPEGEDDAAAIMMTMDGQWIQVWKDINENDEETLFWSLKNVPNDTPTEKYVGIVDSILKCKFKCIDWSTSRFEDAYSEYKREPKEVKDNEVRLCDVKLFLRFWEFPVLVFRFEETTHIIALETKSMSVIYYTMEPRELFQKDGISLGTIETCPKMVYSRAKNMEKITLFDTKECSPKKFLSTFFLLDKTKIVLNNEKLGNKKIKPHLDKCSCVKTCKKGTFRFHHRDPQDMEDKINELKNQNRPWYMKGKK